MGSRVICCRQEDSGVERGDSPEEEAVNVEYWDTGMIYPSGIGVVYLS